MPVDMEVKGLLQAKRNLEKVAEGLRGKDLTQAFRESAVLVLNDAKRKAPVDTGRLRNSLAAEVRVRGRVITGVVGTNVKYAPYMEMGTGKYAGRKRHFPPPKALDVWARRHGFSSGYVVARAIFMQGGLKPRRFLQEAFDENKYRIQQKIGAEVKKIVKRGQG